MAIRTVANLIDVLTASQLLSREQLDQLVMSLQAGFAEPAELAEDLVHRGWLTVYQAKELFLGKERDLIVGPYIVLELIGCGAMGRVWKARHRRLDRLVALKIVRPEYVNNAAALERFHHEAQAAARLSHPNIVSIFDADRDGEHLFLAMEFVPGVDLAELVKQSGALQVGVACTYACQAAAALQHAYERGLVHRDVKPSNLMRTEDHSQIKILDMGLALLNNPYDRPPTAVDAHPSACVMGTPDFMAPEQTLDSAQVDIRADIYSLGCTLYFLLAGQVPFPQGDLALKLMNHRQTEPEAIERRNPGVPAELGDVVRRMMAKKRADRFQTPAEAGAALEAFRKPGLGLAPAAIQLPASKLAATHATPATLTVTPPPRPAPAVAPARIDTPAMDPRAVDVRSEDRFWLVISIAVLALLAGLITFAIWLLHVAM
jgi:serine/threonine-protein kinase